MSMFTDGGSEQVALYDPAEASLTWSDTIQVRFPGKRNT